MTKRQQVVSSLGHLHQQSYHIGTAPHTCVYCRPKLIMFGFGQLYAIYIQYKTIKESYGNLRKTKLDLPMATNPSWSEPLVSASMASSMSRSARSLYESNVARSCGKLRLHSTMLMTDSSVPNWPSPAWGRTYQQPH